VKRDSAVRGRELGVYRIGLIFVTVLAIVLGLLIGILNHDLVKVDLLWFQLDWPLGLLLLFALTIGLLVGVSLMWLFTVIPLRLQLRKVPNLVFFIDDSLDYIEKIDNALSNKENPIENRDLLDKRRFQ